MDINAGWRRAGAVFVTIAALRTTAVSGEEQERIRV